MKPSGQQHHALQYSPANRKHVTTEKTLVIVNILRYATFLFALLIIQACQPVNDSGNQSPTLSSDGLSTLQLSAPRILLDARAVDVTTLGVEVEVSYTVSGTTYQDTALATRSGSSWELDIAIPRNTPFNISMTWFTDSGSRLDLARITRSSNGFDDDGRLSFSQDFSSAENFSNDPLAADYAGFDDDGDDLTNLEELIDGTNPTLGSTPPLAVEDQPPALNLSTTQLPLATTAGSTASGALPLGNTGDQPLTYSISSDSEWLTASPASGQIAAATNENIQVNASCGSINEDRTGTLTITSDGGNGAVPVQLTCTVAPIVNEPLAPSLSLNDSLDTTLNASLNDTASDTISFGNSGDAELSYTLTSDASWLTISPQQGTVAANGTVTIAVSATCGAEPSELNGTINLVSDGGNAEFPVSLVCSGVPGLGNISTTSIELVADVQESAQASLSFTNTGAAPLNYTLQASQNWLCLNQSNELPCTTSATTLPGQLSPGASTSVNVFGTCPSSAQLLTGAINLSSNAGTIEIPVTLNCQQSNEVINPIVNGYEFINIGNGAVSAIVDVEDSTMVRVVQTVPVADSPGPSSINTPITLFFDDKLLFESLFDNILVLQNGVQVNGTVTITESSNGFAIVTFVPDTPYDSGVTVGLSLTGGEDGVLDDGGNALIGNSGNIFELSITTLDENSQVFDNNLSFENVDSEGVLFSGDGAVQFDSIGCLAATDGNNFAAISTGSMLVSSNSASGGTSSTLQIGPINIEAGTNSLLFDFNFVSAEFLEYVGSIFDDSSTLSVTGPEGTFSEVLTTVNIADEELEISECSGIEGLTRTGFDDSFAGQTGWLSRTLTGIEALGSPITITFTVTDVEDSIVHSILAIDNIRF